MELAQVSARTLVKLGLTVAVLAAGIRLAACGPRGAPKYYLADELIAGGLRAHEGELVRVHGWVEAGSIERLYGEDTVHSFLLVWHGVGLRVQVHGALPDTFRDQSEVIVTGQLVDRDGWRVEGTAVIAKCTANYQGTRPGSGIVFR
jgi:cytochrome c-type biogenesis protein CcmE